MTNIMLAQFPAAPDKQVTLANWRTSPFNKWAFHHVREIVPSAEIANDPVSEQSLEIESQDLTGLSFVDQTGKSWAFNEFVAETDTDALVVLKNGKLIYEYYANGMDAASPHILMSVSKSLLGLLFGILDSRGVLDPECPVTDIIPEINTTAYAGATLRHLLDMRAGIHFDEDYLATSGAIIDYRKATNWNPLEPGEATTNLRSFYHSLLERDGAHGRSFHYVSPNTDLLGWAIERASGKPFAELMSELFWRPMGATRSAYVTVDRLGAPRVAGGVCTTARDLALVGQLLVDGGARNGATIIPKNWISDIAEAGDQKAWERGKFALMFPGLAMHYRTKWYVERSGGGSGPLLFGVGVHGQNLFVDSKKQLVIAKFSSQAMPLDDRLIRLTSNWVAAMRTTF
ncbi:MAG: serine hydrolase [Rhodospirillaceae bacterium]|nr:serine hydrolase [Rhodospirillaceae bacterium]